MRKLIVGLLTVLTAACSYYAPIPPAVSTGDGDCPGIRLMWADSSGPWGTVEYIILDDNPGGILAVHINEGFTLRLCISNGEFRSEFDLMPGDADFPYDRDWHYSLVAPRE